MASSVSENLTSKHRIGCLVLSKSAPKDIILLAERYVKNHGYGIELCSSGFGLTLEWAVCCAIKKAIDSHECVIWIPSHWAITNPGVTLQSLRQSRSTDSLFTLQSAVFMHADVSTSSSFLDECLLVSKSKLSESFFGEMLKLDHWSGVKGGAERAVDELLRKMPSLRDLVRWYWRPSQKLFRFRHRAKDCEYKATAIPSWKCGDFAARVSQACGESPVVEIDQVISIASDHGIAWQARGLGNRIGPMATDKRHIGWMRTLLLSRKWRVSLEVGCLGGASSVAFVDAVNERTLMHAHFCDKRFTPEFHQVVQKCWGAYTLHEEDSCECLSRFSKHELDFVYVDGDHSIETLQREYHQLARLKPAVVAAHDVVGDDGPGYLMVQLQRDGYFCLVDCKRRKGEGTHRGFLVACRDYDDYQLALEAYRRHIW